MPGSGQREWQVKKTGKFVLPGLFMIKTRKKAATKGGVRSMFGKEVKVKAQPAKTVASSPVWYKDSHMFVVSGNGGFENACTRRHWFEKRA